MIKVLSFHTYTHWLFITYVFKYETGDQKTVVIWELKDCSLKLPFEQFE